MKNSPSIALACLLASTIAPPAVAESELTISADTPTTLVKPRGPERAPLTLPELEYNFRINATCHNDLEATSVSLAVADTRRTFNLSQIASGELNAVSLRIPSNQIAPVVIANFCVAPMEEGDTSAATSQQLPLTIHSALSAQASLLCVSEGYQSMKYASAALDVQLQCEQGGNEPEPAVRQ